MTDKDPIFKPFGQDTKEYQEYIESLKMYPEATNSVIMFPTPIETESGDAKEGGSDEETTEDDSPNVEIEISPADVASVDPLKFLKYQPFLTARDIPPLNLPKDFTFSLSDYDSGSNKYGKIVTSSTGDQSINVNVQIEPSDGIIDYEVRLIKND